MKVVRALLLLVLAAALLFGDSFKLYLKDGGYHAVREYQVTGDRVRYFSTERGEWEEIPVELVDLAKTERERKANFDRTVREAKEADEEEQAERALKREVAAIPMEAGAYYKSDDKVDPLPAADYQIVTDKKRRTLQILSPVPIIPGKASVLIKGDRSRFTVAEPRPSFYLRLSKEERFGIVSLTPKKNMRIVENIAIIPAAKQAMEERKLMDTFEQQLGDNLYRVWPEKPLSAGEYALIEFADNEDMENVQLLVWDFACRPAAGK